jgi:hypothetical protein
VQQTWFLAWFADAVAHGLNPLFSTSLNAPAGINLVTNTSAPLLGILAARLTWWLGPLTSYEWLLALGMWLSALSFAYVARRIGLGRVGAVVAGAVYGFSARRFVRGDIHVFLTFEALVPLMVLIVVYLVRGTWSPRRAGLWFGMVWSANLLISLETTFVATLGLFLALAIWAIQTRQWLHLRQWAPAIVGAGLSALPLGVVVGWEYFFGPGHVATSPHAWVMSYAVSLGALLRPGPYGWWAPFGHQWPGALFHDSATWTNPSYVGVVVIGIVVAAFWRGRHRRDVRLLTVVGLLGLIFSFGTRLHVPGLGAIPMPLAILRHLPFFSSTQPLRYELWVFYIAAFAVGWVVDQLLVSQRWKARLVAGALVVATAASLVPATTYAVVPITTEAWFQSPGVQRAIPDNAITLTYPYAIDIWNMTMLDQAQARLWYRLVGGQAIVPNTHGVNVGIQPVGSPLVFSVLWRSFSGQLTGHVRGFTFHVASLPPNDEATARAFRLLVQHEGVRAIIWRNQGADPALALSYLSRAFGLGEQVVPGQVVVWRLPAHTS